MIEGLTTLIAKFAAVHWISAISSSAIVAAIASIVRIVFSPKRGFWHGVGTFFGGVLVGTLIGYIVTDIQSIKDYNNAIVAAASIGAREFVEWILERFQELRYMRLAYLLSDEKFKHYQEATGEVADTKSVPAIIVPGDDRFSKLYDKIDKKV